MLFKIFHNPKHPLYSNSPGMFHSALITRGALSSNNLAFSVVRSNTIQFPKTFHPAVTRLWNDLPNHVVEYTRLPTLIVFAIANSLRRFGIRLGVHSRRGSEVT